MNILFSKTMNQLSGMLDYRSTRHKVIASNIANIDTPGYTRRRAELAAELPRAVGTPSAQQVGDPPRLERPRARNAVDRRELGAVQAHRRESVDGNVAEHFAREQLHAIGTSGPDTAQRLEAERQEQEAKV